MNQSKIHALEELLQAKTKAELNLLGNKLRIKEYAKLNKQQLIAQLLKKPRLVNREFNPSFWSKHSGHIYGLASIIGLVIAAFSVLPQLSNKASANAYRSPLSEETREGVLAVMPFENQTNDPELASISLMLMDWISQGLLETGETRIIKEDPNTLLTHIAENSSYTPPGAEVLIRGRYYKLGEGQLSIITEIVNANNNLVIYSPEPFIGNLDEPMQLIDNVKQQILGYWKVKDDYHTHKPPRYDAYTAYVKGFETSIKEPDLRASYFREAMKLDPEFYGPGISMMYTGVNGGNPSMVDEANAWLAERMSSFNEYEQLQYKVAQARAYGDFSAGADAAWELYEKYNSYGGASFALYFHNSANHLTKVLALFQEMENREKAGFFEDPDKASIIGYKMNALIKLGQPALAASLYDHAHFKKNNAFIPILGLKAYALTNQFEKIDSVLDYYNNVDIYYSGFDANGWLYSSLCTELFFSDHPLLTHYLDLWEKYVESDLNAPEFIDLNNKVSIAYMRGDLEKAYQLSLAYYDTDWGKGLGSQMPGLIQIKMGNIQEGRDWMEFLSKQEKVYTGQKDYALGMLQGYLGNTEAALMHFKLAVEQGFDYDWYDFRDDMFWKEFLDNPELMEFTEPT